MFLDYSGFSKHVARRITRLSTYIAMVHVGVEMVVVL